MKNDVNVWGIESSIYPKIDAMGIKGNSSFEEKYSLGKEHIVDFRINNFLRKPLSIHSIVTIDEFIISLNFRKINETQPWFRVDNESKNKGRPEKYLHFHLDLDGKKWNNHQEIKGIHTVSEIISLTFDSSRKILKAKYPMDKIIDSDGFVGFA